MNEPFVVAETSSCGCTPESRSLKAGGYIDGPIVAAVLDLGRWPTYEAWRTELFKFHGKGMRCQLKRAVKAGMTVEPFEKSNFLEDWVAVDLSKPARQGRPMGEGYRKTLEERGGAPSEWRELSEIKCPRHYRRCIGAFVPAPKRTIAGRVVEKRLVAYISTIRTDELLVFSQILGHSDFLPLGAVPAMIAQMLVMLYATGGVRAPQVDGVRGILYGGFGDGQEGLRHFKTRMGFEARRLVSAQGG